MGRRPIHSIRSGMIGIARAVLSPIKVSVMASCLWGRQEAEESDTAKELLGHINTPLSALGAACPILYSLPSNPQPATRQQRAWLPI